MDNLNNSPQLPDAQWLPDPQDPALERWWDGETWMSLTRPRNEQSGVGPLNGLQGFSVDRPMQKRLGLTIILACIALLVVAGGILSGYLYFSEVQINQTLQEDLNDIRYARELLLLDVGER